MKLLALFLALTVTEANENLTVNYLQSEAVQLQDEKKLIDKEELPEAVVNEFNQSVYKEWSIDKVYMLQASDVVSYELHLSQNEETMVLLANSEGVLAPKADS